MAEPFYVAGTGRADVGLMQAAPGRIFVKTGAEGVYCAAVPELGLGIALKCDDGAGPRRRSRCRGRAGKAVRADDGAVQARLAGLVATGLEEPERRFTSVGSGRQRR